MDNVKDESILDMSRSLHSSVSPSFLISEHQIGEINNRCFLNQLKQSLHDFWNEKHVEICDASPRDIRGQHMLPLARIKKVMKSNEQVKMISAETPMVFSKACEIFIMELTLRAWMHTKENKRRTLQRCDVAKAIRHAKVLDFLRDSVPMEIDQETAQQVMVDQPGVQVPDMTLIYPIYEELFMRNQEREKSHHASISPPTSIAERKFSWF